MSSSQDKIRKRLETISRKDENRSCADCGSREPRWASANLGVFICLSCSGIHRNLGVHISFVRSVNLDTWKEEQVVRMGELGNAHAKAIYEANVPAGYKRPHEHSSVRETEKWIRDKYEHKRFMAKSSKKSLEKPHTDKKMKSSSVHGGASKQSRSHNRERAAQSGTSISHHKRDAARQHKRDEKVVEDLLHFAHDETSEVATSFLQQSTHNNGMNPQQPVHNASTFQSGCYSLPVSPALSRKPYENQLGISALSQCDDFSYGEGVSDFGEFQSALGHEPRPRSLPTQHPSGDDPLNVNQNNVLPADAILSMFNSPQCNAASNSNTKMVQGGMQVPGHEAEISQQHQMSPVMQPSGLKMEQYSVGEPVGMPGMDSSMDQDWRTPNPIIRNPKVLQHSPVPPCNGQEVAACGQNNPPAAIPQMHRKDHFANLF